MDVEVIRGLSPRGRIKRTLAAIATSDNRASPLTMTPSPTPSPTPSDDSVLFRNERPRRHRLPSVVADPPRRRFVRDGLDYRRPVFGAMAARTNTVESSNEDSATPSIIDLTAEDEPNEPGRPQATRPVAVADSMASMPRAQRLPRFGREVMEESGSQNGRAEGENPFLRLHTRNRPASTTGTARRGTLLGSHSHYPVSDDVEIISIRPRNRPVPIMRQPEQPLAARYFQRARSPSMQAPEPLPIDLTAEHEDQEVRDLEDEDDGDVVITEARQRDSVNSAGPRTAAGTGTIGIGEFRHAVNGAARPDQGANQDYWRSRWQRNAMVMGNVNDRVGAEMDRTMRAAIEYTMNNRHLNVDMDYATTGFDMGLQGGNRPATPKYSPPAEPAAGFTRNPGEEEIVVCPHCGDELGTGESDLKQQVWVVKTCGHAYCGECTQNRSRTANKKGKGKVTDAKAFKRCVVEHCGKSTTSKTAMLHVFLGS